MFRPKLIVYLAAAIPSGSDDRGVRYGRYATDAGAKDLLRRHDLGLAEVAARVGHGSASSFGTAFSRHVGQPPSQFASAG